MRSWIHCLLVLLLVPNTALAANSRPEFSWPDAGCLRVEGSVTDEVLRDSGGSWGTTAAECLVAPSSAAPTALISERPPVTLYHQGDLSNGVSATRPLSTSPSPNLGQYRPQGQLYQFQVPADVYDTWRFNGSIQTFNDLHAPSGIITPEVRVMPPASGQMNDFLVPPG